MSMWHLVGGKHPRRSFSKLEPGERGTAHAQSVEFLSKILEHRIIMPPSALGYEH